MASLAYLRSMMSRGVSWSSSLPPPSGCLSYVFISASSSRCISIKIKSGRELWIPHAIFFTKEKPKFQYPLGTVSCPMQPPTFCLLNPNPSGLIVLTPSLWALIRKPQRSWMRPYWRNKQSQLLKHSSHCFGVCLRDELSTQGFKINFMQNGVWTFKGGEGTEDWLVQQIKLEIMLMEYSFILYNAKNEDVNENILWTFHCTEWNT